MLEAQGDTPNHISTFQTTECVTSASNPGQAQGQGAGQCSPPKAVGGSAKSRGKGCGCRKGEERRLEIEASSTGKAGEVTRATKLLTI